MKAYSLLAALALATGAANSFAGTVELNGIASLFGENMAFIVLHEPGQDAPVNFYLLEGQSQHGIKLLAVDRANRRVQIEQAGQTQYVRLSLAQDLSMPGDGVGNPGQGGHIRHILPEQQMQLDHFLNEDPDVQKLVSGAPVYPGAYVGSALPGAGSSANTSGSSSSDSTSAGSDASGNSGNVAAGSSGANPDSSGSSSSSDTSSAAMDYTKQYWYVTSRNIELNRFNTAAQVLSGAMGPLPRTPLTPSGTPPQLIGDETVFSGQIPGFTCGGSVDGWSADAQDQ